MNKIKQTRKYKKRQARQKSLKIQDKEVYFLEEWPGNFRLWGPYSGLEALDLDLHRKITTNIREEGEGSLWHISAKHGSKIEVKSSFIVGFD